MMLKTTLISGAGNIFHITWNSKITDIIEQQRLTQVICKKNQADGFIFLKKEHDQFTWDFYNNDGSVAEMCGNATRCVGYYIKNILNSESHFFKLNTMAGTVEISSVSKEQYQVQMTKVIELKSETHFFCDTGVPHIVVPINDFDNYRNYFNFCKNLRFHSEFAPRGTNVTLVCETDNESVLHAVTYERGVEDFTAACGTGAAAAAFFNLKKKGHVITTIRMPGGDLLFNLKNINQPIMIGPAILLGEYSYDF